jgi:hypothetical protein
MALETSNVVAGKSWLAAMRKRFGGAVMALTMATTPNAVANSNVYTVDGIAEALVAALNIPKNKAFELLQKYTITQQTQITQLATQVESWSGQKSVVLTSATGERFVINM